MLLMGWVVELVSPVLDVVNRHRIKHIVVLEFINESMILNDYSAGGG